MSVRLGRQVSILFCVFWDLVVFCLVHMAGRCRFEAVGECWYYMMMLVFNSEHFFYCENAYW